MGHVTAKEGSRVPVPGEAPVRNIDMHIFRHQHCDKLDGISLEPILSSFEAVSTSGDTEFGELEQKVGRPLDFAITQRMSCKLPGSSNNDPYTPEWTDFCPFKYLPRNPAYGAMGYSIRTRHWRYTAWLEFDTNSFLPSLHIPPMAEELYDHREDNLATNLGLFELVNLAYHNDHHEILNTMRLKLFDFLW